MAINKNKFNRLASEMTERVRSLHRQEPQRLLSFHYVEAFKYALSSLRRDEGLSGQEITALRKAVLKKLGLK